MPAGPEVNIQPPACPCWKALSLFLNREGRTKSQPRASCANSFLRSGSWRRDSSFILILTGRRLQTNSTLNPVVSLWLHKSLLEQRYQCPLSESEPPNARQQLLVWLCLPFQIDLAAQSRLRCLLGPAVHTCTGSGSPSLKAAGEIRTDALWESVTVWVGWEGWEQLICPFQFAFLNAHGRLCKERDLLLQLAATTQVNRCTSELQWRTTKDTQRFNYWALTLKNTLIL